MADVDVTHDRDRMRYEAHIGEDLAGSMEYVLAGPRVVLTHTEVDPAHEGKGVGGALVRGALDDIRDRGDLEVVPVCPFVASWIQRHPEYAPLVTEALRPQFER